MNQVQYDRVLAACKAWRAKGKVICRGVWGVGQDRACALRCYARINGCTDDGEGLTQLGLSAEQVNQFLLGFDDDVAGAGGTHPSYLAGCRLRRELGL